PPGPLVAPPGAVVAAEDDERPALQAQLRQRRYELAHAPVDLLDGVAVGAARAAAGEALPGEERDVRHRVGEVEEERPVAVRPDETDGLFDVAAGGGGRPWRARPRPPRARA